MSRKVLIVTYHFPPRLSVGSLRMRGLAKYLPNFGWEPIILTATLPGKPDQRFRVIETFCPDPKDVIASLKKRCGLKPAKELHKQLRIPPTVRADEISFRGKLVAFAERVVFYPCDKKNWRPSAIRAGTELLQRENIDVLISSSGPVTTHLIAKELKIGCHIPWVADLRDLWSQNHFYTHGSIESWFQKKLEIRTLLHVDALVTVSKPLAAKLGSLHRRKCVFSIPNGFDPEEVREAPLTKDFTVTYAGQWYSGKRDPSLLFRALRELIDSGALDPTRVKVRFFGQSKYWIDREIGRYKLEAVVHQYGRVSRELVLTKERESQVLLLVTWGEGNYTGKLFEYLAAKRPILAHGGHGSVVSELMEETNTGIHVSNLANLKDVLIRYYKEYKGTGKVIYRGKEEEINKYSHYEMARQFAKVLDSVTGRRD